MKEEKEVKISTAKEFLGTGESNEFRAACARVQMGNGLTLDPTKRQVRKWRRREGLAFKQGRAC